MFKTTKTIGILCAIFTVIESHDVLAQSPAIQRISLPDAQARAGSSGNKLADLARLGVDAARYHRQAAEAQYWPKIDSTFLNLHFNKLLGPTIVLARGPTDLPLLFKDQTFVAFTVTQPVTPMFKVRQAVQIAQADEAVAQAKVDQANAQIAANVERNYFDLLIAQRQQKAAEGKVNTIQSGLQIVTTGTTQLSAVTERQLAFLEASKTLATISSRVTELTHSLNLLIGFEPETELELLEPEPATDNISRQGATQQAQANSFEVVEAEQTVVKAKAAATLSKLDYVPDVAVIGGYAFERVIPILPRDFSFVGFVASLTLFDFGKRENTVNERSTELALARSNVDLVKAKVAASAQKAYLDLQRTRKIRDLTRQIVSNYQVTLINYPKSAQETDAARAQAEAEMFQAELDYRLACYELKRVMDGH